MLRMKVCFGKMGNWGGLSISSSGWSHPEAGPGILSTLFWFCTSALDHPLSKSVRSCLSFQALLTGCFSFARLQRAWPLTLHLQSLLCVHSQFTLIWGYWHTPSSPHCQEAERPPTNPFLDPSVSLPISRQGAVVQSPPRSFFRRCDPLTSLSCLRTLNQWNWKSTLSFLSFHPDSHWGNIDYCNLSNHHVSIGICSAF